MRVGQKLGIRRFDEGGLLEEDYIPPSGGGGAPDPTAPTTTIDPTAKGQCEAAGGNWTGYTCDYSQASGGTIGGVDSPAQFDFLSGLVQDPDAMAEYLQSEYGLQNPEEYLKAFEAYDPSKEHDLQKSYKMGMGQAQAGARGTLGDLYAQARSGKGGGFGSRGKKLSSMVGKTLSGLQAQKAKLGQTFASGIEGLREGYVGDWLGQVGKLGQMGATFCKVGEVLDADGNCVESGTS